MHKLSTIFTNSLHFLCIQRPVFCYFFVIKGISKMYLKIHFISLYYKELYFLIF